MKKDFKYILTEQEYNELKYKLALLEDSICKERDRLSNINNKSDSEVISSNTAEYNMSLIYDISGLIV